MNYSAAAPLAVEATLDERALFVRRTYTHLTGAIAAFVALCGAIQLTPAIRDPLANVMTQGAGAWLVVLGLFMGVSFLADRMARSGAGAGMQYLGLLLYVAAQAVLFTPLLAMAALHSDSTIIPTAGLITLLVFGGLTLFVFVTKKDFSFMRGILAVLGLCAIGALIASFAFSFTLPAIGFSAAMIGLSAGYVLYTTSNVLHHYRTDMHVAASLALFAAITLMLWYVLRLLMALRR